MVVRDKHGKHVPNLRVEDFTLSDNGKEQKIGNFEEVRDTGAPAEISARPASISDKQTYSNFVPDTKSRGLVIIAIDANNFLQFDGLKARGDLINFLQHSLRDDTPVSLLVIGSKGIRTLHEFTTDTRVLRQALATVGTPKATAGPTPDDVMIAHNNALNTEVASIDSLLTDEVWAFQQRQRVTDSLDAMESIANAYAGVPGRKALVWLSSNLPFAVPGEGDPFGTSLVSQYERDWRALNAANIAVYPVDARGVFNPSWDAFDVRSTHSLSARSPIRPESLTASRDMGDQTTTSFLNLAKYTGGKACIGRNTLDKCFEIAADEAREFYMLSFYVSDRKPGWHKLNVKVHQPDVHATSRTGYFVRDYKPMKQEEVKTEIAYAITGQLNATAVPFQVKLMNDAPSDGKAKEVQFAVTLAPRAVELGSENELNVEISGFAKLDTDKKNEKTAVEFSKNLSGKLRPDSAAQILNKGLSYRAKMTLQPGQYTVKFVVRDNNTAKIGTVAVPVAIK